ncbi:MAG: hypothetical protein COU35_03115 [Candidatus Magasanikbacteria bacterium CG10_big_fil_rev_8_21_14_0_10_47_10]|uniref:Uncharacterized protein n=1 Tax=Candidatus Magasanikbacteria bacterium CG10_big_fil_rev_8_21_14_0_10_47_10 TaxID=1974652 RepID=A0A2H0TS82_9BACT|nr:MAG: hypothetical protein COU35_03115 [Candidatus Magasanikbacteria bacterium CG10_big_fil_rev_8_21_14_0_10_47_10]
MDVREKLLEKDMPFIAAADLQEDGTLLPAVAAVVNYACASRGGTAIILMQVPDINSKHEEAIAAWFVSVLNGLQLPTGRLVSELKVLASKSAADDTLPNVYTITIQFRPAS